MLEWWPVRANASITRAAAVTDQRDTIYAADSCRGSPPRARPVQFRCDSVARVFPDMIKRSVPGYTTIVSGDRPAGRSLPPGAAGSTTWVVLPGASPAWPC